MVCQLQEAVAVLGIIEVRAAAQRHHIAQSSISWLQGLLGLLRGALNQDDVDDQLGCCRPSRCASKELLASQIELISEASITGLRSPFDAG